MKSISHVGPLIPEYSLVQYCINNCIDFIDPY